MEVTFRGRRSTLCALDVCIRKVSWQVQGVVRLRVVVEVNVDVKLLVCFREEVPPKRRKTPYKPPVQPIKVEVKEEHVEPLQHLPKSPGF